MPPPPHFPSIHYNAVQRNAVDPVAVYNEAHNAPFPPFQCTTMQCNAMQYNAMRFVKMQQRFTPSSLDKAFILSCTTQTGAPMYFHL